MIKNFFKIALRNLLKYKTYTFINIAGLAVGLASCLIILLYVVNELSYDRFHENADDIYRVTIKGLIGNNEFHHAVSSPPMAKALVDDLPEVIEATRLQPSENMLIRTKDEIFIENRFLWADTSFFKVFSFPLILGEPQKVLAEHHTVVLTEKLAMKYFGRLDCVGEMLEFEDFTPYKIAGVCKNPPENSHFKFDMIASLSSLGYDSSDNWLNHSFHTYIQLTKSTDPKIVETKFPGIIKKYVGPELQNALGASYEQFYNNGGIYEYHMQPLTDIHLKSNLEYEIEANSDITYVYIFSIIALFILLIACINFMNLSTARSTTRAREVGIRKVMGSNMSQLVKQFLSESIILTAIAMVFALVMVYLLLPYFNNISGRQIEFLLFGKWYYFPMLLVLILFVGTAAGIYPAFYLSSFQPVKVLKTSLSSGKNKGSLLRSGLVVMQFSISIILFISTLVVWNQLNYIQEKNLGWDKDHIFVIKRAWAVENSLDTFCNELLENTNILSVSSGNSVPGRGTGATIFRKSDAPRAEQHLINVASAKYDLDKTFKFEFIGGRFFSKEFPSDTNAVVLNESAVKSLGLVDPVGKQIVLPGPVPEQDRIFTVVGVLKDFHYESFHQKIRPLVYFFERGWPGFIAMRITPQNVKETIAYVEKKWEKFIPSKPLEYFFMDEDFNRLYDAEVRTSKIFSSFSLLAIFIACLGLFGMATFTTLQRTKEIGIRKTLGASVPSIVYMLLKEFNKWVILANIVAWPIAFYFMQKWLEDFEYRVDINIYSFLIAGLSAILIAVITVSYQALKAAYSNPVKSLRQE
ncbi:MAG: FtsX-like permease family protein [Melioribacteraceae bacterium]|nr:MAG: FtsX-like permease family protein [Melioribacteraceae bacterium]